MNLPKIVRRYWLLVHSKKRPALTTNDERITNHEKGPACRQAGFAPIPVLVLLLFGIAAGVLLIQNGVNFLPRADDASNPTNSFDTYCNGASVRFKANNGFKENCADYGADYVCVEAAGQASCINSPTNLNQTHCGGGNEIRNQNGQIVENCSQGSNFGKICINISSSEARCAPPRNLDDCAGYGVNTSININTGLCTLTNVPQINTMTNTCEGEPTSFCKSHGANYECFGGSGGPFNDGCVVKANQTSCEEFNSDDLNWCNKKHSQTNLECRGGYTGPYADGCSPKGQSAASATDTQQCSDECAGNTLGCYVIEKKARCTYTTAKCTQVETSWCRGDNDPTDTDKREGCEIGETSVIKNGAAVAVQYTRCTAAKLAVTNSGSRSTGASTNKAPSAQSTGGEAPASQSAPGKSSSSGTCGVDSNGLNIPCYAIGVFTPEDLAATEADAKIALTRYDEFNQILSNVKGKINSEIEAKAKEKLEAAKAKANACIAK